MHPGVIAEAVIGWFYSERMRTAPYEVLSEVLARRRTEISAAANLGISTRQTRRLLVAYSTGGGGSVIHKARGRPRRGKASIQVACVP